MAIINKLENAASIVYGGNTINSNAVNTLLLVLPTIVKAVDKLTANIGDTLTYTVTITNLGLTAMSTIPFTDVLPVGSTFVTGSFKVGGAAVTPTLTNNTLTYTIPNIPALGVATIQFQTQVVGGNV